MRQLRGWYEPPQKSTKSKRAATLQCPPYPRNLKTTPAKYLLQNSKTLGTTNQDRVSDDKNRKRNVRPYQIDRENTQTRTEHIPAHQFLSPSIVRIPKAPTSAPTMPAPPS